MRAAVSAVLETAAAKPSERGSVLNRWLRRHHDDLEAAFSAERADWPALVAALAEHGITDQAGQSIKPETARRAWLRTRNAVSALRAKRTARSTPAQPRDAPGVRKVALPEAQGQPAPLPAECEQAATSSPMGVAGGQSAQLAPAAGALAAVWEEMEVRSGRKSNAS